MSQRGNRVNRHSNLRKPREAAATHGARDSTAVTRQGVAGPGQFADAGETAETAKQGPHSGLTGRPGLSRVEPEEVPQW